VRAVIATESIVDAVAEALGVDTGAIHEDRFRAACEAVASITGPMGTERPDGMPGQQVSTLNDLAKLVGRRVQVGFYGWTYGDHGGIEWGDIGVLGCDDRWMTIDERPVALFGNDGRRGTPYVRVRFLDRSEGGQ
jgi:hypothetical protein